MTSLDMHVQSSVVIEWLEVLEAQKTEQETSWEAQKASWDEQKASQKASWDEQKAFQKALWEEQRASWAKLETSWNDRLAFSRKETLRAEGKLSSRGIFERMLELVASERGITGRFNATKTIQRVGTLEVQNFAKGEFS